MLKFLLIIQIGLSLHSEALAQAPTPKEESSHSSSKQVIPEGALPLYFDKETYGYKLENPVISWNLEARGEASFAGLPIGTNYGFSSEAKESMISIQMRWPQDQFKNPVLFIYDHDLKQIGEATNLKAVYSFDQKLIPGDLSAASNPDKIPPPPPSEGSISVKWDFSKDNTIRRVCIFSGDRSYSKLLCSPIINTKGEIQRTPSSIVINGEAQPRKASLPLEMGKEFEVDIVFPSQLLSLHINSKAPQTEIVDLAKINADEIKIIGHGAPPKEGSFKYLKEKRSAFWLGTMGDLRDFFEATLPIKSPTLPLVNPDGLNLEFIITWKTLPLEENRAYTDAHAPKSTYEEKLSLKVFLKEGATAESSELQIEAPPEKSPEQHLNWLYSAPKKFDYNHSRIKVQRTKQTDNEVPLDADTFTWEVRRMPKTFLSGRLGASLSLDFEASLTGEGIVTHWFERGLGQNRFLGPRRWGVSVNYLDGLFSTLPNSKYKIINADLLYRFTSGTHNWDETFGLSLSYSSIKYLDADTTPFMGVGLFWSRSLPQWFDNVYGLPEFLKKPKWVDISATAYPQSMASGTQGSLYQVRATGRIQLTPETFYEVGWGILNTTFINSVKQQEAALTAGRAFLGYGVCF